MSKQRVDWATLWVGLGLILFGFCSPSVLKLMRDAGVFGGSWGGFGLFVISLYLRPWLIGVGALLALLGLIWIPVGEKLNRVRDR
jgi:hypothetical protein